MQKKENVFKTTNKQRCSFAIFKNAKSISTVLKKNNENACNKSDWKNTHDYFIACIS